MARWLVIGIVAVAHTAHAEPPLREIVQLSVGQGHVCGVTAGGAVVCWGDNAAGQAGISVRGKAMPTSVTRPHVVGGLPEIRTVAAGAQHTCAISVDEHVWCWGSAGSDLKVTPGGASGSVELRGPGLGTPVELPLGDAVPRALAVGGRTACVATTTDVRCWSTFGTIPLGATKITAPTFAITKLAGVTKVALGHGKVCAITESVLQCWSGGRPPSPSKVAATAISIGENWACTRDEAGQARCWFSLIDDFWKRKPDKPITWSGKRATRVIVAGDSPICTADSTGAVDCFLSDEQGLPDQAAEASWASKKLEPHRIAGVADAIDVGIGHGRDVFGYGFGCALRGDRTVACWGDNEHGQLGRGTTTRDKTAAPVIAPAGSGVYEAR